jgi:hypothetical protein
MDESRRSLIKKATIGAGVVWATPAIESLVIPASAAGTPPPPPLCLNGCPDIACADGPRCGEGLSSNLCICGRTVEGDCVCFDTGLACLVEICDTSADCPAGSRCVVACSTCPNGSSRFCGGLCGSRSARAVAAAVSAYGP